MTVQDIQSVEEFESAIASGEVVVDFYAEWCGPCKSLAPLFEQAAAAQESKRFVKVNVDVVPVATRYGVRSIPTIIRFSEGQVAATNVGSVTKASLDAFLSA
jgi:thioredoxin 1